MTCKSAGHFLAIFARPCATQGHRSFVSLCEELRRGAFGRDKCPKNWGPPTKNHTTTPTKINTKNTHMGKSHMVGEVFFFHPTIEKNNPKFNKKTKSWDKHFQVQFPMVGSILTPKFQYIPDAAGAVVPGYHP